MIVDWIVPASLFVAAVVGLPVLALWRRQQICRREAALRRDLDLMGNLPRPRTCVAAAAPALRAPGLRLVPLARARGEVISVNFALAAATGMPLLTREGIDCAPKPAAEAATPLLTVITAPPGAPDNCRRIANGD